MAGFTQRGGIFTVPYDGVYEFGVSLRLDVSKIIRNSLTRPTKNLSVLVEARTEGGMGLDRTPNSRLELIIHLNPANQWVPVSPCMNFTLEPTISNYYLEKT